MNDNCEPRRILERGEKNPYHWSEVMGNNMIYPTLSMLYRPTVIQRKAQLKSEHKHTPPTLKYVLYDIHFVVWRLANILRECKAIDEPKLREIFELVIYHICNEDNEK